MGLAALHNRGVSDEVCLRYIPLLSVMLLTPDPGTASMVEYLLQDSSIFKLVGKGSPIRSPHETMRLVAVHDPELILLDLGEWSAAAALARQLKKSSGRGVVIGFREEWNRSELLSFEDAGVAGVLRAPFSHEELQTVAYDALHQGLAATDHNILALLPAKAGGGCSTVARSR